MATRKKYSEEERTEALRRAEKLGAAVAGRELGIAPSQIYKWRKARKPARGKKKIAPAPTAITDAPLEVRYNALLIAYAEKSLELDMLKRERKL